MIEDLNEIKKQREKKELDQIMSLCKDLPAEKMDIAAEYMLEILRDKHPMNGNIVAFHKSKRK